MSDIFNVNDLNNSIQASKDNLRRNLTAEQHKKCVVTTVNSVLYHKYQRDKDKDFTRSWADVRAKEAYEGRSVWLMPIFYFITLVVVSTLATIKFEYLNQASYQENLFGWIVLVLFNTESFPFLGIMAIGLFAYKVFSVQRNIKAIIYKDRHVQMMEQQTKDTIKIFMWMIGVWAILPDSHSIVIMCFLLFLWQHMKHASVMKAPKVSPHNPQDVDYSHLPYNDSIDGVAEGLTLPPKDV